MTLAPNALIWTSMANPWLYHNQQNWGWVGTCFRCTLGEQSFEKRPKTPRVNHLGWRRRRRRTTTIDALLVGINIPTTKEPEKENITAPHPIPPIADIGAEKRESKRPGGRRKKKGGGVGCGGHNIYSHTLARKYSHGTSTTPWELPKLAAGCDYG
jgi:hypothetical protein